MKINIQLKGLRIFESLYIYFYIDLCINFTIFYIDLLEIKF